MLYRIAQRKDAILANVLGGQNGFIHWDIHITHSIHPKHQQKLHPSSEQSYKTWGKMLEEERHCTTCHPKNE